MGLKSTFKTFIEAYKIASHVIKEESGVTFENFSNTTSADVSALLGFTGERFQTEAYNTCSPLQAVISKKAQSITRGNIIPIDSQEIQIPKNTEFDKAYAVVQNPNDYQTEDQFIRTIETFINIYGSCYIYKIVPEGFSSISSLIVIPNNCICTTYNTQSNILTNDKNAYINYYTISLQGVSYILRGDDRDKIFEIQDVTINATKGKEFRAKSRIDALRYSIENIVASQESRNTIIIKRGADGMLAPDKGDQTTIAQALGDKERSRLQSEYAKYGTLKTQFHTLISKVPMKYTSMTKSVADLGLFDGENADQKSIALSYGVPVSLLGLPDTAKYNTYLEAKKDFYEDTVIPESEVIAQAFDKIFKAKTFRFKFDYSHLTFMQTSKKDKADVFGSMVSSLNEAVASGLIQESEAKDLLKPYM